MQDGRATQPVDVARLNSGIFLALFKRFGIVVAICLPIYFGGIVAIAALRLPQLSTGFVLAHVWFAFAAFAGHLAFGLALSTFWIAVGSLAWWRHVLARGGPNLVLVALASLVSSVTEFPS
jgi:hypothetical protein